MPGTMNKTRGYGVKTADGKFTRIEFSRNACGADDIEFDVIYCGICHSDVHLARNHLLGSHYPVIPGHELAGVVTKIGANVQGWSVGEHIGVGCVVDSCLNCEACEVNQENYCLGGFTHTYDNDMPHKKIDCSLGRTAGGYSEQMTIHKRYAIKIPKEYPLASAGPVFCAGITLYSPLKHWGCLDGSKTVGIVGIGGLGQMGMRLAKAMGCKVYAFSSSPGKKDVVMNELKADGFILTSDEEDFKSYKGKFDLIINSVSAHIDAKPYVDLLKFGGSLVYLGLYLESQTVNHMSLFHWKSISASGVGGIADTQEVMDFCQKHGILAKSEIVTADKLDWVYDTLNGKSDTITRYILDIKASAKIEM